MPPTNPPTDAAAQIQWLVDRAAIADLISNFGVSVDDKDHESYTGNFIAEGTLELPFGTFEGRDAIAAMPTPPPTWRQQHLFANIIYDFTDADHCKTRAYMVATHIMDPDDTQKHARAGGWYEHEIVRTEEGWRFASVKLTILWQSAPMLPGEK